MRSKFGIVTVVLLLLVCKCVNAQNQQFQFSRLDIRNGLSHNQVTSILKDNKGFMWFGTLSGLNKYDGHKFKIFKHSVSDTTTLNDDFIVSISQGPDNKIWVETRNGFNIYDPEKEIFIHDVSGYLKSINIPDANITSIKRDRYNNYWFIHAVYGIYKYNSKTKATTHIFHKANAANTIYSNAVSDVTLDSNGNIWLIYNSGLFEELNPNNYAVEYRSNIISKNYQYSNFPFRLFIDNKNDMWAYVPTYSSGVFYVSADKSVYKHLDNTESTNKLSANVIYNITQDDKSRIWIATDHGGINLINKSDFTNQVLLNREDDDKTLSQNSIISMYKDDMGIIWIGTYKRGISYYHESVIKFPLFTHHLSNPNSLAFNDVNKFAEDAKGNLWLGTNGGGLIYFDRKTEKYKQFLHQPGNQNSLCNNVIVSMCIDHDQKLWIGTYFGGLDCYDGKTFVHYRHNPQVAASISEDAIWSIYEDHENQLWVGTLKQGLNLFDRNTKTFTHFKFGQPNSIHSNYISSLLEDRRGKLWIITSYGVDVYDKSTHQFSHYIHDEKDPYSLINNNTNNVLEDSRGLIWISTREGISIFNPLTGKFKNVIKEDGLPDNTVLDIQEDQAHNMWVSTPNGLSNITITGSAPNLKLAFNNYNETDGLQGREFTQNASYKTRSGELIFGGGNGFNIFKPSNIRPDKILPDLRFTDFQIFNHSVKAGEEVNGHVILPQSITTSNVIDLKYDENVFAIEFALLNYFDADKANIQYTMQGFDKSWLTADNSVRSATYTNLDAGHYVFKLRMANNIQSEITLHINIAPPFWKTPIAYLLYLLLFCSSLLLLRRRGIQKIKSEFELEKEREGAKRLHELDLMKIKFFTNVSHEFRTPLSLIIAPLDKILKNAREPELKSQVEFASRNARRLLNMVNQLLDFRKMEVQQLQLHCEAGDVIAFLNDLTNSFADIAESKGISYFFTSDVNVLNCEFDHDKFERIFFNLLSNAFKFTSSGGHISVVVNAVTNPETTYCQLTIKVIDTGIGIPPSKYDKIFEPFFQNEVPGSMVNQGSGIGLSITREFVKLQKGEIGVESTPGEGSTFTVTIPIKLAVIEYYPQNEVEPDTLLSDLDEEENDLSDAVTTSSGKRPTVLIVEDNNDFRFYIKDNLKHAFNIIEAADGKQGWQKTLAAHPNLVVCDISMPEMNGIELCAKIKGDTRTTHIPVLLLTALVGENQQLEGLATGATDYMTKPFNFEILLSKIKNILAQQENMRRTYQKQVEVKPTEELSDSPVDVFLQKLLRLIEDNIDNANFSVEELSSAMFVSRYTLYKKILAVTGKTPNEFIRHIRLKRAAQLLESGHLTISQICYKVGFKTPKYFVKAFKAEFDIAPSQYQKAKRGQD
jgi:signal transduction histidine kinase/ligand-binding sensor domain-containing protein/DNA-binding response OmpR family regulator